MKVKKTYVNNIALLALSLVIQNSYAAQDASWWQRLTPSTETLTGMSWAAPGAIAAQRAFSESKLPSYSYFIPGAVGTALGTVARSDQGWSSAFLTSLLHQSPSFALAALLWAMEKWNQRSAGPVVNDLKNEAELVYQDYNTSLSQLLDDFKNALKVSNVSEKSSLILPELLKPLKDQYDKVVSLYNDLIAKKHKYNNNRIEELAMLTPAEILYADYLSYMYVHSLKHAGNRPFEQLTLHQKQRLVADIAVAYKRSGFIQQLIDAGFKISYSAVSFVREFANLLEMALLQLDQIDEGLKPEYEKGTFLMRDIFTLIKGYEQALDKELFEAKVVPPVRPIGTSQERIDTIENESTRLRELFAEYEQRINDFVGQLFSNKPVALDKKYDDILLIYKSLQESFEWLRKQGIDVAEGDQLLAPYDYIYAAVNAPIIKQYLSSNLEEGKTLNRDDPNNIHVIADLMNNKQVNSILAKFKPLKDAIDLSNAKNDEQRNERIVQKVIDFINTLIIQESQAKKTVQPKVEALD